MIPIEPISFANPEQEIKKAGCRQCATKESLGFDFEYAYQPIVDMDTRSIYAHEALVRGPNGESAYSVLSKVYEGNRYQFDQACRVKAVQGAARYGMQELLSINFMPNAVYRAELCIRSTLEAAKTYNFPVERIIFEVSEGENINDRAHLVGIFKAYSKLGFLTAIDDFGAGYSGLNLLADYQPDIVKIDMGLIRDIDQDKTRQSIVRGIIAITGDLGKRVLAEGIETKAERDFLKSEGISLMQGYYFSKPVFQGLAVIDPAAWV